MCALFTARFLKYLYILAEISEKLSGNKKPILVGGSAVEFYTRGTCKSIDIDLLGDRDSLVKLLEDMGFSKTGRHWFYTKDIGIEIVRKTKCFLKKKTRLVNAISGFYCYFFFKE